MSKPGTLYLIPMGLGEPGECSTIPEYVRSIAGQITHFIVENEKTARHYLKALDSDRNIRELSFFPLDKRTTAAEVGAYLEPLSSGLDVGLISEAGCPAVADPGADVVALAHKRRFPVSPLVGPSSILLALMASGMNGQSFTFHGYLPIEKDARIKKIKSLEKDSHTNHRTQIFMETPYRNQKLFEDLLVTCRRETRLCVAVNLTLPTQMIRTQNIADWKKHPAKTHKMPAMFLLGT